MTSTNRASRLLVVACMTVIIATSVGACAGPEKEAELPISTSTALSQAAGVFQGSHTQAEIKIRLDRALTLYGLPITEENYSRAGSTLVALRRANGTAEMAILDHMIRSHVAGVKVSFPEAAGLSSAFLKVGDR